MHVTAPATFWSCPSTVTFVTIGADALLDDALVPEVLLEQPTSPATTIAVPSTPATASRFIAALLVVG
ncbi:hypothetical protein MMAD_31200 [Mycolicibacterium madagascariense]|uniref:Uncharacterized protein n=1 Tax=Mycolicibacterium madagascariense TaxID=212765 RepID=A0A7I7XIA8_9MYCO|nr:hypothetical protein MMAD_31200 [Mycolicibacterium madagascariense]